MADNAIATKSNAGALNELLQRSKKQIEMALPRHLSAERLIRVAVTAVSKTPALQDCSPLSICACVIQSAELGLELSNPLGHAYMVPYKNKHTGGKEAQFQIGYRGLIELAYRSGRVSNFQAHVVYENDVFNFAYGTKPSLKHVPTLGEPGPIKCVYAVICFKDGSSDFEVMSVSSINAHRARYSKSKYDSPWDSAWEEMAKKTVIRRLAKRAPLSADLVKAAVQDEYTDAGVQDYAGVLTSATPVQLDDRTAAVKEKLNGNAPKIETPAPQDESPTFDEAGSGQTYPDEPPPSDEQTPAQIDLMELQNAISEAGNDQEQLRKVWELVTRLGETHGRLWESTARALVTAAGYEPATAGKPRVAPGTGRKNREF